jgi:predicted ATPase
VCSSDLLRQLELDPWREEAHRQVMRVLAANGDRSAALAQYETCRRILAKELGVEPSAETQKLYEQIRQGKTLLRKPSPPAPVWTPPDLPVQSTPFVGRESELGKLAQLLANPECRLLTLVGSGGIGKTRLALQVAANQRDAFAQGAAFIPLASTPSADFIAPAIADAVHLPLSGPNDPGHQLLNLLKGKEMLLILDNYEHLLEGSSYITELLKNVSCVKLLVTSREQLNERGERVYEVQGLEVPDNDQAMGFEESSAVALFLQHARRARHGFELQVSERTAVLRICRLVGGTPLALELAAAWVRVLTCNEIADQIEQNLDFLSSPMRDMPERHRSMRAVFNQSWKMLAPEERKAACKLSVFRGGFNREASEQVTGASLYILASLVGKSLVCRIEGGRYGLHELVWQYARAQLAESGELESTCADHLHFFLTLAEQAEGELHSAGQLMWLDRLEKDHDNLRAALEWSLTDKGTESGTSPETRRQFVQASLRLVGALYYFWRRRSHWSEGRTYVKRVLALSADWPGTRERAKALNVAILLALEQTDTHEGRRFSEENLTLAHELQDPFSLACALESDGILLWKQKEYAAARASCEQALALFRKLRDRSAVADSLHYLGHIAINQDDYPAAQSFLDENVALCRELNDGIGLNDGLGDLGLLAYLRSDYVTAQLYLQESLAGFRQAMSIPGSVAALNRLGDLARCEGDYEKAGNLYSESLTIYRDFGDKDEIPSLMHNLAYVELHRGAQSQALAIFREALAIQHEMGNRAGIAECLAGIAGVFTAQEEAADAAQLFGSAHALREASGAAVWPANRLEYDRSVAILKRVLGEPVFVRLWREGRELNVELVIARAMSDVPTRSV